MARTVTLGTLVTRCQRRADLQNQDSPSTSDWKGEIHLGYAELYGELAKPGVNLFDTEDTITTTGGAIYPLPDDHLVTIGVDYVVDLQGTRRQLAELEVQERNWASGQTGTEAIAFRATGASVVLYPTPPTGQTYQHVYIPQPADLSAAADATLLEMATLDGENFLIWWVVSVVKETIGQDSRVAREEREAARERLQHWVAQRVFNSGRRRIVMDDIDVLADNWTPGDWCYGGR
jgi:hypothetical protein